MKVGDKVIAIWKGSIPRPPVKGAIVEQLEDGLFVFKGDNASDFLHKCNRRFDVSCGYYVRGYGRTPGVEIKPLEKIFNGLELR